MNLYCYYILFIFSQVSEGLWFVKRSQLKLEVCLFSLGILFNMILTFYWWLSYTRVCNKNCEILKKKKTRSVLFLHLRFSFWPILSALVQINFLLFSRLIVLIRETFLQPTMSLLFWCLGPMTPLSNFVFRGRISLTIICKNQSISINFEIAAVKKWPSCAVHFFLSGGVGFDKEPQIYHPS